jgi:hypothetical protein
LLAVPLSTLLTALAVALRSLAPSTPLARPLAALPFVRLLALPGALFWIVLVGRLAAALAISLPGGFELPPTLGAPSTALPLALELGLSAPSRLAGVFTGAIPALAPVVLVALSASTLGAPVSVAHGSG